ncbi:MAG TPA: cupredoxin domain-containing protein, partial [Candidatus Brocadiaceae bacterium]
MYTKFMINLTKPILILSVIVGFLCGDTQSSKDIYAGDTYTEIEVAEGGTVVGNVKYGGELAALSLNLYADMQVPDTSKPTSEKLIVSSINNGLKNAVVSITNIKQGKKKTVPLIHPLVDQQKNTFVPGTLPILAGTTVDFLNGDEELHNI